MAAPALLDVNVLLALLDRDHVMNDLVTNWFDAQGTARWATCAVTENGFVRIVSQPRYPHPLGAGEALARLRRATGDSAHQFWPCDVSITDPASVEPSHALTSAQVTDLYLLALAVRHGGRFVTFDRRVSPGGVPGATADHVVVL